MKYLLALILVLPLLTLTSEAQNYKIAKQVIAGGGILNQSNSNGISISGMLGQPVIFKQAPSSPLNGKNFDLYQGFWVPEPLKGVGVNEDPLTSNGGIKNNPNPVTSSTNIKYELKSPSYVSLRMYDMVGNVVATIFEGYQSAGEQSVLFNAKDASGMPLAAGSYVYELNVSPSDMAGINAFTPYLLRNVMIIVR
jgi:hypothetical protein